MNPLVAAAAAAAVVLLILPARSTCPDLRSGWLALAVVSGLGVAAVGSAHRLAVPVAAVILGVGWATARQLRTARARKAVERRSGAVIEVCEGLAADLRAGQPPFSALQAAARDWPEFQPVADAGRLGGDIAAALRLLARQPGASGLRTVAAAWVIAHRSGAGLADAVALAARVIRDERATARVVETEMASARATARLLAALPVGVLLIGRGAGGDPFGFLLGTAPGLGCLVAGLALSWLGLSWLERIARSVHR